MSEAGKSYHIEHFRPRRPYSHLLREFSNLFLSCGAEEAGDPCANTCGAEESQSSGANTCGAKKRNCFKEDCHVAPNYPDCVNRFRFLLNGDVVPTADGDLAAQEMIDILNLNHPELREDRRNLLALIDAGKLGFNDFIDPAGGPAQGYAHVACRHLGARIP